MKVEIEEVVEEVSEEETEEVKQEDINIMQTEFVGSLAKLP